MTDIKNLGTARKLFSFIDDYRQDSITNVFVVILLHRGNSGVTLIIELYFKVTFSADEVTTKLPFWALWSYPLWKRVASIVSTGFRIIPFPR